MVKKICRRFFIVALAVILASSFVMTGAAAPVFAENDNPHLLKTFIDGKGRPIDMITVPSAPPEYQTTGKPAPEPEVQATGTVLSNVPSFDWSYGCSATSAAMLFGYYDRVGYGNMYTGTTNGGICPLTNEDWGHTTYPSVTCGETPISATHIDVDGLTTNGHVDDFWVDYGNSGDDPVPEGSHPYDCTADFMGYYLLLQYARLSSLRLYRFGIEWLPGRLSRYETVCRITRLYRTR